MKEDAKQKDERTETSYVTAVIGTQWGDEGKGKIVDLLAQEGFEFVVRYNGGANAGHSIQAPGQKKIHTHLMPSGILTKGVINVIANGVVLDPWQIQKEINECEALGHKVFFDNLRISERAHIVLPYHKQEDALSEAILSKDVDGGIGTTKKGIGPTYADQAHRSTAIRFCDLYADDDVLREMLERIVKSKVAEHQAKAQAFGIDFPVNKDVELKTALGDTVHPYDVDKLFEELKVIREGLKQYKENTVFLLHEAIKKNKRILIEGANATMLSKHFGTYPFVTSSDACTAGIGVGTGLPPTELDRVVGIVKAYSTRVGEGPFVTEMNEQTADKTDPQYDKTYIGNAIREKGHEFGTTTGRPRRIGWLDLPQLAYSLGVNGVDAMSIMLFDVLADQGELKICEGYELDGVRLPLGKMPASNAELAKAQPLYKIFKGFGDISQCDSFTALPKEAIDYLSFIETTLGKPIEYISIGPERNQTLSVKGGVINATLLLPIERFIKTHRTLKEEETVCFESLKKALIEDDREQIAVSKMALKKCYINVCKKTNSTQHKGATFHQSDIRKNWEACWKKVEKCQYAERILGKDELARAAFRKMTIRQLPALPERSMVSL